MKAHKDVGELLSNQHEKEKEINRAYLHKVLPNIFLARQGLPKRGYCVSPDDSEGGGLEIHSKFHQLLFLCANDDPTILEIMQHRIHGSPYSKRTVTNLGSWSFTPNFY